MHGKGNTLNNCRKNRKGESEGKGVRVVCDLSVQKCDSSNI